MKAFKSAKAAAGVLVLFAFGSGLARAQAGNNCVSPLDGGLYSKYTVVEFAEFSQTNADSPVPYGSNSFYFEAAIGLSTNMTATAAMVTIPNSGPETMRMTDSSHFLYVAATNNFANLASAFPSGSDYSFIISNNTTPILLPAFTNLPNAPTLANYAAAQAIDPAQDFTLSWVPFSGGRTQDYIDVELISQTSGTVFKSGEFGCPISLDGTASSVIIPANTLVTNEIYDAEITFVKVLLLDTNSVPGDAFLAGTEVVTLTTVSTSPAQVSPLVLSNPAWLPGGGIRFDLATTPGVTYSVQFTEDLSDPTGWSTVLVSNAAGTSISFTNNSPSGTNAGFYRASQN
jgi:hypothetical protein